MISLCPSVYHVVTLSVDECSCPPTLPPSGRTIILVSEPIRRYKVPGADLEGRVGEPNRKSPSGVQGRSRGSSYLLHRDEVPQKLEHFFKVHSLKLKARWKWKA